MNILSKLRSVEFTHAGVTLLLSLYYATIVNLPIYKEFYKIFQDSSQFSIGFALSIPIFLFALFNIIFNIFSWPFITRPFFILLLITSSGVSYAALNYGIYFSYGMIENIFQTDTSEAASYINLNAILWGIITGVLPSLILASIKIKPGFSIIKKLLSLLLSAVLLFSVFTLYYKNLSSVGRNHSYLKKMIIPTYYIDSTYKYLKQTYFSKPIVFKHLGEDAHEIPEAGKKPTLFVFVLGETARMQNYELNGYAKDTNEYTRQQNVISYKDVSSCGTATAVSVPCMFSSLKRVDYNEDIAKNEDNVLDILKRAGIGLLWKENDGGDKDVAKRIKKITLDRTKKDQFCNGSTCYDMGLLEHFDDEIKGMKPGDKLVVLHLIGSHGPTYYLRYPETFQKFLPDCQRSDIQNCTKEEITNTYDNTIHYTDYVVNQTIEKLKGLEGQYNTALWYMSDHGESLGEDGVYLHGLPYSLAPIYQKRVPLILWMSDGFKKSKHINEQCLKTESQKGGYSQDYLFSSLLGIMDVQTKEYVPKLDLYHPCRDQQ